MWEEFQEKSTILPPLSLSAGEKSEERLTSVGLVQKCQKAFKNTMNERHFGLVVQCIDRKVTENKEPSFSISVDQFVPFLLFLHLKKIYSVYKNAQIN